MRHVLECSNRGEIARSATHQKEIAGSHRRCGHIADDGRVESKVHEAHGEAAHGQPFSTQAVDDDPVRNEHCLQQRIDFVGSYVGEYALDLFEDGMNTSLAIHRS